MESGVLPGRDTSQPMSQANIEIAERANAAFNRRDVDAVLEFFAPDAELRDLANAPDQAGVIRGVDSIRDAWTLWTAAFDELRADIEELIDAGEFVVEAVHWQGRGKASGMSIDVRQFDIYEFRDGKVVRATLGLNSKAEALEAAGLAE
jgi:ketosteroid isomerase-like protein